MATYPEIPDSVASNGKVEWRPAATQNYFSKGTLLAEQVVACVWHTPEGTAEATVNWFANPKAQASTHFVVAKTGTIYQCVPLDKAGYGQGVGKRLRHWKGVAGAAAPWVTRGGYNQCCIGIEVEGFAKSMGKTLTLPQFESCVNLRVWLRSKFRYMVHDIRHSDINTAKTDPGELPVKLIVDSAIDVISGPGKSGWSVEMLRHIDQHH